MTIMIAILFLIIGFMCCHSLIIAAVKADRTTEDFLLREEMLNEKKDEGQKA